MVVLQVCPHAPLIVAGCAFCTRQMCERLCAAMLQAEGSLHLVVTHKSIARALLCVALGILPEGFRAIDVHNGGVCIFRQALASLPLFPSCCYSMHRRAFTQVWSSATALQMFLSLQRVPTTAISTTSFHVTCLKVHRMQLVFLICGPSLDCNIL